MRNILTTSSVAQGEKTKKMDWAGKEKNRDCADFFNIKKKTISLGKPGAPQGQGGK